MPTYLRLTSKCGWLSSNLASASFCSSSSQRLGVCRLIASIGLVRLGLLAQDRAMPHRSSLILESSCHDGDLRHHQPFRPGCPRPQHHRPLAQHTCLLDKSICPDRLWRFPKSSRRGRPPPGYSLPTGLLESMAGDQWLWTHLLSYLLLVPYLPSTPLALLAVVNPH